LQEDADDGGFFASLAATARLFQSTRAALSRNPVFPPEIERLIFRASSLLQALTEQNFALSKQLDITRELWLRDIHSRIAKFAHGECTRNYGLGLAAQIEVNCILARVQEESFDSAKMENASLCMKICKLGERDATHHRPLGSAWIGVTLIMAYIGAISPQDKVRVTTLLTEYAQDFSSEKNLKIETIERLAVYLICSNL